MSTSLFRWLAVAPESFWAGARAMRRISQHIWFPGEQWELTRSNVLSTSARKCGELEQPLLNLCGPIPISLSKCMQPVAPLIRVALHSEIAELSQLIDAALAPFRGNVPDGVLRRYIAYARDIGGRWEDGEVWVAEVDGDIVGTVTLVNTSLGGWASIQTLAVRPSMRGRGVGRRLIDHSIARARQRGVSEIRLVTGEFMIAARHLYESMGFTRCAERDFFASSYFANLKGSDVKILAYDLKLG